MIHTMEFRAMNTDILLAAEGERVMEGMRAASAFIDDCEQRFSRFLPASEVTSLNRSAGNWQEVSDDLLEILQLSLKYHFETKGLFDPSILTALKRTGYDRSMDEIRVRGVASLPPASVTNPRPAFHEIKFDLAGNRVRLPRGVEVDLGGIAKGWIVKKAAELLHTYAETCAVSAGGDMLFVGHPSDGSDWEIFLEDPRDPLAMISQLHLGSGAVATSSVMKRTWSQGGVTRHHLIDPRTGGTADTDWLSVTVISPDILTAEVYAKAILIGGAAEAADLLNVRPDLTYLAVDPEGNLLGSPDFKEYIYESTIEPVLSAEFPY